MPDNLFDCILINDAHALRVILSKHEYKRIIESRDARGDTPLTYAISHGNLEMVTILLQEGAFYYPKGKHNLTPHQLARRYRADNPEVYDKILQQLDQAKQLQTNPERFEPRFIYSLLDNPEISLPDLAKILEKHPQLKEVMDKNGDTPLINATERGNVKLVEFLLAQGVDVFNCGRTGSFPSKWAFKNKESAIGELLVKRQKATLFSELMSLATREPLINLDYNRDRELYNYAHEELQIMKSELQLHTDKNSPIAQILRKQCEELSAYLLPLEIYLKKSVNVLEIIKESPELAIKPLRIPSQQIPWKYAIQHGCFSVAQHLIKSPMFDVAATNPQGVSVLLQAQQIFDEKIHPVDTKPFFYVFLIELGLRELRLPEGAITPQRRQATALLILQNILEYRGLSPSVDCPSYLTEMSELLDKFPTVVNTSCDASGKWLLDIAIARNRVQDVRILLDKGMDCFNHLSVESLISGQSYSSYDNHILKMLRHTILKQAYAKFATASGATLTKCNLIIASFKAEIFQQAIQANDVAMVKLILQHHPEMSDMQFKDGCTALGIAARHNAEEILTILLQYHADPLKLDSHNNTARNYTSHSGHKNIIKLFCAEFQALKSKLSTTVSSHEQKLLKQQYELLALEALIYAVTQDNAELIKTCYKHYPTLFHRPNEQMDQQLFRAINIGSYLVIRQFFELNIDLMSRYESQVPLHYAERKLLEYANENPTDSSNFLAKSKVIFFLKMAELKDAKQKLPSYQKSFFAFFYSGTIKRLQQRITNLPVDIFKDAIKFGFLDIVQQMLKDDPTLRNGHLDLNKKTALIWAVCEGNLEVVKWFLSTDSYSLLKDKYGRSAREWAIVLKSRDADNAEHFDAILQALDARILDEFEKIATTQFPTPDYVEQLKLARFRIACQRCEYEIVTQLLSSDATLINKEFDESGDCALISAVKLANTTLFDCVLTYNVDVLKVDQDGNTALDIARECYDGLAHSSSQRSIYQNFIKKLEALKLHRDLEEAIIAGQLAKVKLLVNSEIINHPIGLQKLKPLELAAKYNRMEIAEFLLSHCGAHPEIAGEYVKNIKTFNLIGTYQTHEAIFEGILEQQIQTILKQLTTQLQARELAPLQTMLQLITQQEPHITVLLQQPRGYPKLELLCLLKELLHIAATAADEIQLQQLLQALFAKREALIKGTDWDYCSSRSPSNQLCIALAQKFFPTQPPLKILWATALSEVSRQNKPWEDPALIMLEQADHQLFGKSWHTLRTVRDEIHVYKWVVNQTIAHIKAGENTLSSIWIGTDLLHSNKPNLTSPEWLTLAQRSPTLNTLLQYTMRLEDAVNNPTTPLAALEALCSGLRQGDYEHNGDNHFEAGSAAFIAVARFGEWFNGKSPDFRAKVRAVGQGEIGRVIDVVLGTKLRTTQDGTYCVKLKADALRTALDRTDVKKELAALGKADLRLGVTDQQLDQWQQHIETELAATPNVAIDMVGRGDLDIAASAKLAEMIKYAPETLNYQSLYTINKEEAAKALLQQKLQQLQGKMIDDQHANRKHVLNFVFSIKDYFCDCDPHFKNVLLEQVLEFLNHSRFDGLLRKHNKLSLCYAYQRNQWIQTSETWLLITAAIALEKSINLKTAPQIAVTATTSQSPTQTDISLSALLKEMGWNRKRNMSKAYRSTTTTKHAAEVQQEVRNLAAPAA